MTISGPAQFKFILTNFNLPSYTIINVVTSVTSAADLTLILTPLLSEQAARLLGGGMSGI
ncbi:MAG: hypothetical protein ACI8S3_001371 [Alphaproteobacteria bacterium]